MAVSVRRLLRHPWIPALLLTLLSAILFIALFPEHYETGDDFWINSIASGMSADRDYHLVFNHVFLGHLLVFLNTAAPSVPWYGLLQYLTAGLALASIVYLLLREKTPFRFLPIGLLLTVFSYELFIKAEFTKVSGFAAAAGIMLLIYSFEKNPLPRLEMVLGLILLFISSLYRITGFLGVLVIWLFYGISRLYSLWKQKNLGILKRYLILLPMLCVCLGVWGFDYLSYQSDEGWRNYKEFLKTEKTLNDFSYPEYTGNEAAYEAAGFNENARTMYSHMDIADPEKYTIEHIRTVAGAKQSLSPSLSTFAAFLRESLPAWFRDYPYVYAILFFFVFALYQHRKRLFRGLLLLIGTAVLFLFSEYGLYLRGRYGLNRVDLILFFSAGCVALMMMLKKPEEADDAPPSSTGKQALVTAVALAGCLLIVGGLYHIQTPHQHGIDIESSDVAQKAPQKEFYALLNQDQAHTYLIAWSVSDYSMCFGPLDPIGYQSSTNQIYLGGWLIESPIYHAQLQSRQIENPFRALSSRPDVFLLQNGVYIENSLAYLNDYYPAADGEPYYGVLTKDIGGNLVYKITNNTLSAQFLTRDPDSLPDGRGILTEYTEIHPDGNLAAVSGSLYRNEDNSFLTQYSAILKNKISGEIIPFYLTQSGNPFAGDLWHGQYSAYSGNLSFSQFLSDYEIYLIYQNGDNVYSVSVPEDY